jgi:hypothetical protein
MTQAPPELSINLMDGSFYGGDPFPAFEWMRQHAPAYYDAPNDPVGDRHVRRSEGGRLGSGDLLQRGRAPA